MTAEEHNFRNVVVGLVYIIGAVVKLFLQRPSIVTEMDGGLWIDTTRKKTDSPPAFRYFQRL